MAANSADALAASRLKPRRALLRKASWVGVEGGGGVLVGVVVDGCGDGFVADVAFNNDSSESNWFSQSTSSGMFPSSLIALSHTK